MRLEKVALLSSLAMLGGFLVKEILKARVRLRTMATRLEILKDLINEKGFESLHFNPFYDNKVLAKDVISLEAYKKISGNEQPMMTKISLEGLGKGAVFGNEKDYTAYILTKENIQTILDCFADLPEVEYVLFIPEPYAADESYFSYRIVPADKMKNPLSFKRRVEMKAHAFSSAMAEGDDMEGEVQTQLFAMTSERTGILYMNPSPPASSSFSQL